jgi:hypothetical protein
MALLTSRPGLRYLGGRRFGAWLSSGLCADHASRCSGIARGPRFFELSVRGRTAGVCW